MIRVAFIHPDLGIGGAERLIVDAALALKSRGHELHMFTAHHDPKHCFSETRDGTLRVTCVGDWLPRHFFHKGYAFWAYLRMIYVAIYLVFFSKEKFNVVICDQVSACIPILKFSRAKILFYCHFPDQLLTERKSWLKKLYRAPIDWVEEKTTGMADQVLVNSNFTAQVFQSTFASLSHVYPTVIYPSLNFTVFDQRPSDDEELEDVFPPHIEFVFLSINRYERKKNLPLAIKAFAALLEKLDALERSKVHLVMAGGYDERVVENKKHYLELRALVARLGIANYITFLRSFTDKQKIALLNRCSVLLYTPSNEHFGICPLEGMYMRRPVVAVNSGGPLETVIDGKTGFLCDPTADSFSEKMLYLVQNPSKGEEMGQLGHGRVEQRFSFEAFTQKLDAIVGDLASA